MPRTTRTETIAPPTRAERGFTVVEIMVALFIVVILCGLLITLFRGSKTATYSNEAKSVGAAYAQAISQYQADHANRNPKPADMPDPVKGPINLLGKPYMSVPDAVTGGRVTVTANDLCGTGKADGGATKARVTICTTGMQEPQFAVRVAAADGSGSWTSPEATLCWAGSTTNTPRC